MLELFGFKVTKTKTKNKQQAKPDSDFTAANFCRLNDEISVKSILNVILKMKKDTTRERSKNKQ